MSFTVAIVGRPNVGKSTLFNRLVGKKLALVDDTPGVTRDRRPGEAKLVDLRFTIIDTAGLEEAGADTLEGRMRAQTEAAIDEADLSLFLIDAKAGLTPVDKVLDRVAERGIAAGYALGREYEEFEDGLAVTGTGGEPIAGGATIASLLDHRIAMAMAVAGLHARLPVTIDDAAPVATSYPGFFATLGRLTGAA